MKFDARVIRVVAAGSMILLAACGENAEDQQSAALAAYDEAKLLALVAAGDFDEAVRSIEAKRSLGLAGEAEDLLLLRIRMAKRDGIGAQALIEKLRAGGAGAGPLALPYAKALFMQGKNEAALDALKADGIPDADRLEAWLLEGDIARADEKFETAKAAYDKAVALAPDDFRAYLSLGLMAYTNVRLDDADRYGAKAQELAPDDAMVAYLRGVTARYKRQYDLAVANLTRAVDLNEANQLAYLELAGLYVELDRRKEAEAALDAVYAQSPQNPMGHYLSALLLAREGKTAQAEAMLLRTGDLTRDYPPATRALGLVSAELGKYAKAVRPLSRYLTMVPDDRMVRLTLADAQIKRGDTREAMRVLSPLLAEGVDEPAARALAASAAAESGRMDVAQDLFEKARATDSGGTSAEDVRFRRDATRKAAVARFLAGDRKAALVQLKALADETPEERDLQLLYANLLVQVGDTAAAEALIPRLGNPEENAEAANMLGLVHYSRGEVAESLAFYTRALAVNPDYASAYKNRALAYVVLRRFDTAMPDILAAAKQMPDDGQLHALWGRSLLELGNPADALPHFKQAQAALPRSPVVLADQSEALAALGFAGQAVDMAEAAKKLIPHDKDFAAYLDDKIEQWRLTDEQQKVDRAALEASRSEAVRRRLEEAAETREAIKNNETDPQ